MGRPYPGWHGRRWCRWKVAFVSTHDPVHCAYINHITAQRHAQSWRSDDSSFCLDESSHWWVPAGHTQYTSAERGGCRWRDITRTFHATNVVSTTRCVNMVAEQSQTRAKGDPPKNWRATNQDPIIIDAGRAGACLHGKAALEEFCNVVSVRLLFVPASPSVFVTSEPSKPGGAGSEHRRSHPQVIASSIRQTTDVAYQFDITAVSAMALKLLIPFFNSAYRFLKNITWTIFHEAPCAVARVGMWRMHHDISSAVCTRSAWLECLSLFVSQPAAHPEWF